MEGSREWLLDVGAVMVWNCGGTAGANREGGGIFGGVIVTSLFFGERTVAIGGGVAPCSALEDIVEGEGEGEGDEATVDAEGGSGVR